MKDLISRQAAIEAVNHICPVDTEYDCALLDRVDVRCVLLDLPSAERKKGRWINKGQYADFFPHNEYRCSVCDKPYLEIEMFYNFCPNCGADMRGEEDE